MQRGGGRVGYAGGERGRVGNTESRRTGWGSGGKTRKVAQHCLTSGLLRAQRHARVDPTLYAPTPLPLPPRIPVPSPSPPLRTLRPFTLPDSAQFIEFCNKKKRQPPSQAMSCLENKNRSSRSVGQYFQSQPTGQTVFCGSDGLFRKYGY